MAQNNTWQAHIQQVCCWAAAKACCCRVGKITVLVTEWFMSSAWLEDQLWLLWSRTITWFENTWDIYTMGPVYAFIVKQLENICFSPSNFHFLTATAISEKVVCVSSLKGVANHEETFHRVTQVYWAIAIQVRLWTVCYYRIAWLPTFLGILDLLGEFKYWTPINLWRVHINLQESESKQILDRWAWIRLFLHGFSSWVEILLSFFFLPTNLSPPAVHLPICRPTRPLELNHIDTNHSVELF